MLVDTERRDRVIDALGRNNIDALICKLPENVVFLSGWWPLTGTSWLIFTSRGNCHLIVPACEKLEAQQDGITDVSAFEWAHLKAPDVGQQIINTVRRKAEEFGIREGVIGIEESYDSIAVPLNVGEPAAFCASTKKLIKETLPKASFVDATDVINGLRVRKTPAEIEKLRIANEIAGFGYEAFKEYVKPGVSEIEIAAAVNSAVMIKGCGYKNVKSARGFAQISSSTGTCRGWRPCEITSGRILREGDIVLLELAVVADGYWADNTRLQVAGTPNDKQRVIYGLIRKSQQAAIDSIKPGIKMCDVDKAARDIINEAGYGEYFIHITGHGIGWKYHEFPPLLHPDNKEVLEVGMVTSVEPGIYIPDFMGMRIEDNIAVTARGADVLSDYSREMV
jgi:Xaa-Pro dipeptidase